MNEWARLVDRYASELKKYELVCSFCGQHLSDTNVNVECQENLSKVPNVGSGRSNAGYDVSQQMMYFTDDEPPTECIGSKRHHFSRPSLRGYKQNPFRTSQQAPAALKEEVILSNSEAVSIMRRIWE
jgi:hypothetical protein